MGGGGGVKTVVIHSDGGCHGNPGPGGWAAVLRYGKHMRELRGGTPATTNNRMELQAAIEALNILKEPCEIDFHTDSEYVRNGITTWIAGWKRNRWITSKKEPVKNAELWQQLDEAAARHRIRWHWVKGHAGDEFNERCDALVQQAIAEVKAAHEPAALADALDAMKQRAA
ncbi:MAG: ribonuclease HI [Verrucomicrobiaceae bacterium]|nr:ribonuclease HI [Verrucomicrobiaceae bacterium]